ncbi:DUF1036 domain-containing protein [Hellea balneolensis]|uniref:DUF1036 domain-containing protein n=1 Tax=Hellea balneolensis TaxID=287478 RepID=UPI0004001B28|nr:DUF1036 domain-containing protein [Hellea balneolensis]
MRAVLLIAAAWAFPFSALAQDTQLRSSSAAAVSEWEICNETSYILRLATAYMRGGKISPKGWEKSRPGECIAQSVPLNSPRYIFAESDSVHQGGIREWAGNVPLCISEKSFTADASQSCQLQNLKTQNYLAVDPSDPQTTFIEPDNFGKNAATAGMQRLLKDSGYKITRIDGVPGRRTMRTIADFKKDNKLDKNIENNALIDTMAKTAKARQDEIGLEVCNNSSGKIWTAVATRDDGDWKSRGWWSIARGECLRPLTKTLQGTDAHYYALAENIITTVDGREAGPDKRLRSVATTPAQFCVAEAKFSALGRDYCTEAGYAVANFRPLPTDTDGIRVTLTDQDFAVPNAVGLRQ